MISVIGIRFIFIISKQFTILYLLLPIYTFSLTFSSVLASYFNRSKTSTHFHFLWEAVAKPLNYDCSQKTHSSFPVLFFYFSRNCFDCSPCVLAWAFFSFYPWGLLFPSHRIFVFSEGSFCNPFSSSVFFLCSLLIISFLFVSYLLFFLFLIFSSSCFFFSVFSFLLFCLLVSSSLEIFSLALHCRRRDAIYNRRFSLPVRILRVDLYLLFRVLL